MNSDEETKYSDFLEYVVKFYFNSNLHLIWLLKSIIQLFSMAIRMQKNIKSESFNECLKTYAFTGKINIHKVFRSIKNYEMNY